LREPASSDSALDILQDAANRGSVQSVQVKGPTTGWQDLSNVWGASWETGQVPEGPLDVHIYDDLGVDVRFSLSPPACTPDT